MRWPPVMLHERTAGLDKFGIMYVDRQQGVPDATSVPGHH
jgi:hypothetical protein